MKNKIIFIFLFCFPCLFTFSQRHINRSKNSERQGIWIVYHDNGNKHIDNIGRYRKGIPKGTWKYYDPEGKLIRREKHFFRIIYTTDYHPNGRIKKKGKAKIITSDLIIHYFFYGNWFVYDTSGNLIKKQIYADGHKISEVNFKTPDQESINDSLVEVLKNLNQLYLKYSDSIRISEHDFGKKSNQYQRYIALNNLNALQVLDSIDTIIHLYGYPGKTLVGNESTILFSIISSLSLQYKLKYYDVIIDAANKGELDWRDVAFFVDKVKVAKKEKQVYGTQYQVSDNKIFYFPIEDKPLLNERRKKVGLQEVNISSINDIAVY